jgi:signal transduction histidine kinase
VRRRLLQSTLAVAVVAVALLGVPLGVAGVLAQSANAHRNVDAVAAGIGAAVENRVEKHDVLDDSLLARVPEGGYGVVRVKGKPVLSTGQPQSHPIRGEYHSADTSVLVEVSGQDVLAAQVRIVLLVVIVAAVAMASAVALGLMQGRRLAEPLEDLTVRARRLGGGHTRPSFPRYGMREVDEVAEALDASADRVATMLAGERQFASDASHQLRTPLTALSMRLEEILNTDDPATVREEAGIALGQVERLSAVVDHLLTRARQSTSSRASSVDVDEVIEQQRQEWDPSFVAAGRELEVRGVRGLAAIASPGALAQVVATLLENSLHHGDGCTYVRTRATSASVVVEVADEGAGVPEELAPHIFEREVSGRSSTGLGLALARDLAEADGGRLELVHSRPAVFALFLQLGARREVKPERGGRRSGRGRREPDRRHADPRARGDAPRRRASDVPTSPGD